MRSPLGTAISLNIAHRSVINLAPSGWVGLLRRFRIDAVACLGFHQLLPEAALATVRLALNAHPSRLPQWRGPSPLFWWLHAGQQQNGVSIHHMVVRADAGPLVEQHALAPPSLALGSELASLHGELAGRAMAHSLDAGARGQLLASAQHGRPSWAPRPRPEDAFVRPERWTGARLVRFAAGAGLWQTPRLLIGDTLFFARGGVSFQIGGRLPGEFVIVGDTLTVTTADGIASLIVQQDENGRLA